MDRSEKFDRVTQPLTNLRVEISERGAPALGKLKQGGQTINGLRVTIMFGGFLKARKRVTRPAISRSISGITQEGFSLVPSS